MCHLPITKASYCSGYCWLTLAQPLSQRIVLARKIADFAFEDHCIIFIKSILGDVL